MNYYKVVRMKEDGKYHSAFVRGKAETCYPIGKWLRAPMWLQKKGYHLFVFDSLDAAKIYRRSLGPTSRDLHIYECDVEEETFCLPTMMNVIGLITGKWMVGPYREGWPTGTLMAGRVKLIKQVQEE